MAEKTVSRLPTEHSKPPRRGARSSNVINLRADAATRTLIDSAADILGQNRTEFMLSTARARAQDVLLSQTRFVLSDAEWAAFQAALNTPAQPTEHLVALLASTPPWSD